MKSAYLHTDTYIRENILNGKLLSEYAGDEKTQIIINILTYVRKLTFSSDAKQVNRLPKRHFWHLNLIFPFYFIQAVLKQPNYIVLFLKLLLMYVRESIYTILTGQIYSISYHGLHPDTENCALAEDATDCAIVVRNYYREIGLVNVMKIVKETVKTVRQKSSFLRLTIYYAVEIIAQKDKHTKEYRKAIEYIQILENKLAPSLLIPNRNICTWLKLTGLFMAYTMNNIAKSLNIHFPCNVIFCYHSISYGNWKYAVSPDDFTEHIDVLMKSHTIVPLEKIINSSDKTPNKAAITFDDGYSDVYDNAFPVLRDHTIPAAVFVLGNEKGVRRSGLGYSSTLLSFQQINTLYSSGWEIGYHTQTHASLPALNDRQLYNELVKGKRELEHTLGFPVRYLSYPNGQYSQKIIQQTKESGFVAAFTVDGWPVPLKNKQYHIGRVCLDEDCVGNQFKALLSPLGLCIWHTYVTVFQIKRMVLTHKYSVNTYGQNTLV